MIQQCLWNRLPLFQPQLYFPTAASSPTQRPLDDGGVAGLTLASWRIPTVAKVFGTVCWPVDGLICSPSLPAERIVWRLNAFMVWNLRSFSSAGSNRLQLRSLSEVVYCSRQHLLSRGDPHRVGLLYIECPANLLPIDFWQRPPLSAHRQKKKKHAQWIKIALFNLSPVLVCRKKMFFQCYWQRLHSAQVMLQRTYDH